MSLKTVSKISLVILTLVFILSLIDLYSFLQYDSEYITLFSKFRRVFDSLLWLPFILFFWKIIKG